MIDQIISPLIASLPDVTALVDTRVFPLVLPTDPALPAITFQFTGGSAKPTFNTGGLNKYRVQFDCWGNTYKSASQIRAALFKDLNGFTGSVSDVFIQDCQFVQPIDYLSSDSRRYRLAIEFYIWSAA